MVKKKIIKKKNIKKDVHVNKNTTTPTLPTTRYYIKSWGYYNKYKKIIIEQINPQFFIYNVDGKTGIIEVEVIKDVIGDKIEKIGIGFIIEDVLYLFKSKVIYDARQFYNIPSLDKFQKFVDGKVKIRSYKELNKEVLSALGEMFDFSNELDVFTSGITIGQSWIKLLLNEFFFYGVDASKGAGKTTLGEVVFFMMRHGFIGGDISKSAVSRLVDELDLNIFIDEIDEKFGEEDIMGILRKGQRRGNPYVRCEGRDHRPVTYDIAGIHGYSYRGEVEDAFMDRSLRIHTAKSKNHMLPIINSFKREILKPLSDELFLWFIKNIHVVGCSEERRVVGKISTTTFPNRKWLFALVTKHLTDDEVEFLKGVFGRDNELTFLCLNVSKMLDVDMFDKIKKIIQKKQSDESSSEGFYFETLKGYIVSVFREIKQRILKDGDNMGCPFYPKSRLYTNFVKYLKEQQIMSIGTKRFSSLLRDLGFVEGVTMVSQRYEKYPSACLIFNKEICERNSFGNIEKEIIVEPKKVEQVEEVSKVEQSDISDQEAKKILEDFEE